MKNINLSFIDEIVLSIFSTKHYYSFIIKTSSTTSSERFDLCRYVFFFFGQFLFFK